MTSPFLLAALLATAATPEPLLTISSGGRTVLLLDGVRTRITLPEDGPRLRTLVGENAAIAVAPLGAVQQQRLAELDKQLAAAGLKAKPADGHGAATETARALLRGEPEQAGIAPKPHPRLTQLFGHSEVPVLEVISVPEWTQLSGLYCLDGKDRVAWGVGSVRGLRNHALARTTADNRARVEIAKLIQTQVTHGEGVTRTFTSMTLSGVQIIDHFFRGEEVWALASVFREPPEGNPALSPCPTGTKELRNWTWTAVTPEGQPIAEWEQPPWTSQRGMGRDGDSLTLVIERTPDRPLDQIKTELIATARQGMTARLDEAARDATLATHLSPTQAVCAALPWKTIVDAEDPALWWNPEDGHLFARIALDLGELAGAFEPGCPASLPEQFLDKVLERP